MKKYKIETIVGIFVFLGLALHWVHDRETRQSFFSGRRFLSHYCQIHFRNRSENGNPVNILGIEVGQVEKITMDQENQKAVVEMKIKKGIKIYDDAIASIKTEGLMGDKYISIDPGGSGSLLGPHGTITETQAPVDIVDFIGKYAFGEVKKK